MTLVEVLAPYGVDEDEFVEELSRDLRAAPNSSAAGLSGSDESVLREHGGITSLVGDETSVLKAMVRTSSSNLAEQAQTSFSVEQAAALLLVDGSRVRHRVRDGALFAFKIGGGLRLPVWQFHGHDSIPGLRMVLAALPDGLHPLEVAGLMTNVDARLVVADKASSPREWLIGGGDVGVVVEMVKHLDAW